MIDKIFGLGLAGIHQALQESVQNVQRISGAFSDKGDGDLVSPIVDLKQNERQVEASTKVIKAGDRMLQDILDILA
jgi:flagellar basal body rod protein FlgG